MRLIACALLFVIFTSIVSSGEEPKPRSESVEKAMLSIDLRMQLKDYKRIVNSLHKANFEAAMLGIEKSDSREAYAQAQLKIRLLQNMKETAVYNAMELEKRLKGTEAGNSTPDGAESRVGN